MAKLFKYFGFDKFVVFYNTVKESGGFVEALYIGFRTDNLRPGTLVGCDEYGNKYYENPHFIYSRDRWVDYAPEIRLEYDGSLVPAEWFGWLHHKTDLTPDNDPSRPNYKWIAKHTENLTGTPGQFMPYSTTRPKIQAWVPPQRN